MLSEPRIPPHMRKKKIRARRHTPRKLLTVDRICGEPSLSGIGISQIAWSPDSKLVTYLRSEEAGTQLWAFDRATARRELLFDFSRMEKAASPKVVHRPRVRSRTKPPPSPGSWSYQWSPSGDRILLWSGGLLFVLTPSTGKLKQLVGGDEPLEAPQYSPDGRWVSYSRGYDLSVINLASGKTTALTEGGSEEHRNATLDSLYPGVLCAAYWWSPDSRRIAFLRFDEKGVAQEPLVNYLSPLETISRQRFPMPGAKIPTVKLGVLSVTIDSGGNAPAWMETCGNEDFYLVQVNWLPDSHHIVLQRLNRQQNKLELFLSDVEKGDAPRILCEEDPKWLNLNDCLYFFPDGKQFLWSAERGNFRHLYVYSLAGEEVARLTSGPWAVVHVQSFDAKERTVYFVSFRKPWLDCRLERLRFQMDAHSPKITAGEIEDLTPEPGTHLTSLSPDCTCFADLFSTVSTPPRLNLYRTDGTRIAVIERNPVPELSKYGFSSVDFFQIPAAKVGSPANDRIPLDAKIIKPCNFQSRRKYPALVYVYGGPIPDDETGLDRFVVNLWRPFPDLWFQVMAQKGFVIFCLDNRGSNASPRGHAFEVPIYKRFGEIELADQLEGVRYLKSLPYVDPERIGIFGGSYGGFMTLNALLKKPDVFKAGAAYAPVTNWLEYTAEYTERYMTLPSQNEEGYKNSSPVNHASRLRSKLLLIHGLDDTDVYLEDSMQMTDAFIQAGIEFELMLYPRASHTDVFFGTGDKQSVRDLYRRLTRFFTDHL
jgi:dipeptidyl-peptidase 4